MRNSETNKEMIYSGSWITDENETFVRFRGTLHATEELWHEIDCLNVFHVDTAIRHVRRLLEELDLVFSGVHVDSMLPMPQSCVYLLRHLFLFLIPFLWYHPSLYMKLRHMPLEQPWGWWDTLLWKRVFSLHLQSYLFLIAFFFFFYKCYLMFLAHCLFHDS